MPTHGNALLVAVIWPRDQLRRVRNDIEAHYLDTVEAVDPPLRERLSGAARAERFTGTGHLPGFLRRPAGPGWALIGDAGLHKDPLPASGICDAWHQADALAAQLLTVDQDRVTPERALARYAHARDERFLEPYEATYQLSGMSFSRDQLDLLARTAERPTITWGSVLRQLVHVFAQHGAATPAVVS
jgi:flavin-dependent dehydrogenase